MVVIHTIYRNLKDFSCDLNNVIAHSLYDCYDKSLCKYTMIVLNIYLLFIFTFIIIMYVPINYYG